MQVCVVVNPDQVNRILIVDDDEPTRNLLEAVMRRYRMPCRVVASGSEAIDALKQDEFGCVILDLMMPIVGGQDVIAFLAGDARRVPVIVCTAAGQRSIDKLDPNVVTAVIRKPFDIDELVMTVNALVSE